MLRSADLHRQIAAAAKAEKTHFRRAPPIARMASFTGNIIENRPQTLCDGKSLFEIFIALDKGRV